MSLKLFGGFAAISSVGWLLDFFVYMVLVMLGIPVFLGALVGCLSGALFSFLASSRFVFGGKARRLPLRTMIYVAYALVSNLAFSVLIAGIYFFLVRVVMTWEVQAERGVVALFAKVISTPASLMLNFLVSRYLLGRRDPIL